MLAASVLVVKGNRSSPEPWHGFCRLWGNWIDSCDAVGQSGCGAGVIAAHAAPRWPMSRASQPIACDMLSRVG